MGYGADFIFLVAVLRTGGGARLHVPFEKVVWHGPNLSWGETAHYFS